MEFADKLTKENEQAKALVSAGLASDFSEAIEKVRTENFSVNHPDNNKEMEYTKKEVVDTSKINPEPDTMSQVNYDLNRLGKLIVTYKEESSNEISSLKQEIMDLKEQIATLRGGVVKVAGNTEIPNSQKNVESEADEVVEEVEEKINDNNSKKKAKDERPNHKTGGFKPEDVDVNNIFYFGKK